MRLACARLEDLRRRRVGCGHKGQSQALCCCSRVAARARGWPHLRRPPCAWPGCGWRTCGSARCGR